MKIFPSSIVKEIDAATCEAQGIQSVDLMERAASAAACELVSRFLPTRRIIFVAGPGNNGGDVLAIGRLMFEQGYRKIEIYLFNVVGKLSNDCEIEKERLKNVEGIFFKEVTKEFTPPVIGPGDVVVDGLFGSGLNQPLKGGFKDFARYINDSKAYVVSIDIPSGLFGEWNEHVNTRDMVHADLTLSFQFPKLSFFMPEYEEVIGDWVLLDIGLDEAKIKESPSDFMLVEDKSIRSFLKERPRFSAKRDFGSALLFAGSTGMAGAAVMAARSCLRSGVGLVTVHSAGALMSVLQTAVPEAMFEPDKNENFISEMNLHHSHQAVAAGPGIGTHDRTVDALEILLKNYKSPLVLDADAINCIVSRPQILSLIPTHSIITPHIGEFDRLFGEHRNSEERLKKAIDMAKYYNIIIVLKGHYTMTVRPTGRVYINSTGNPGMATAGSGDVLTGIITSFLAQGLRPELAATIGVYVHGLAGDIAVRETGEYGLLASDIAENCGKAIKMIMERKSID